jgi:hypothetical protein
MVDVGTIRVVSANVEATNPAHPLDELVADVRWIEDTWHPALVGLQEAKELVPKLRELAYLKLAPGLVGQTGARAGNMILYDPEILEPHYGRVDPVHPGKSAPSGYPEANITWCEFGWIAGDGSIITLNNTHVNPHIEHGGQPYDLPRVPLSIGHIARMADKMKGDAKGDKLVLGTGDFNVDHDADERVLFSGFPAATFGAAGLVSVYDELDVPAGWDTLGPRKIDEVYRFKGDARTAFVPGSLTKHDGKADHHHVCVDVAIREKAPTVDIQLARVIMLNLSADTDVTFDMGDALKLSRALLAAGVKLG